MKRIIVTGCYGQLGKEINRLYDGNRDIELINTDVDELDITDLAAVQAFVAKEKPYAIVNCAAHTAVDACEDQEELAYKINAIGPRNLAIAAKQNDAKLMHISTDYVFAGDADKPYREFDVTGPQGVYGASKLAGENFVREFADKYFIIRTAWLYGDGKNFVKTVRRVIKANGGIGVVCDQRGNPTNANDLAHHLLKLAVTEEYGIYHCTGEGECSWYDFAVKIAEYSGLGDTVTPCTTEEYNAKFNVPTKRPEYSSLRNLALECTVGNEMRDWKIALKEYISKVED